MSARQCVALGLRLFALWMCLDAIQIGLLEFGTLGYGGPSSFAWQKVLGIIVIFVLALVVWGLSGPVARGLMSRLTKVPDIKFSAHQAVMVGCVLMGLWWIKQSTFVVIGEWLNALYMSPQYGQSAMDWLGEQRKMIILSELLQIGVGLFFVCFAHVIANTVLRHLPMLADVPPSPSSPPESFDGLVRQAMELGKRQTARADILRSLTERFVCHPYVDEKFDELQNLLYYQDNALTRSFAARVIAKLGHSYASKAMEMAQAQLARETMPVVADDLQQLINLAKQSPLS